VVNMSYYGKISYFACVHLLRTLCRKTILQNNPRKAHAACRTLIYYIKTL
jgi:hypothetical protein